MEEHPWLGLIGIILFVVLDGFISAVISAAENCNKSLLEKKAEENDKKAIKLLEYFEAPDRHLNAAAIILTASAIFIGIMYSFSYYNRIFDYFVKAFESNSVLVLVLLRIAVILVTFVVIYFIVLFGNIFPKKLGIKFADYITYHVFGFLKVLSILFYPMSFLLEKNTNLILRLFRINPNELVDNVTEEEIISIVNEGQEQGVLDTDEAEMISNIIEFDEKQAMDIMTHRKKIVAVSNDMSIEEAMNFMLSSSFSRFPLYNGDIDNIIGVIHLKDVMKCYMEEHNNVWLANIAKEPKFIPDTQPIDVLFKDMQKNNVHMAIAIDEYGQTSGLVAMEDILEEIVGDIQDEYDCEEDLITGDLDGSYLASGEAMLEDLKEEIGLKPLEEDDENYDTLNGLLISLLDRIPEDGEQAVLDYCGFRFEILDAYNKMITKVKIYKIKTDTEQSEENV